MFTLINLWASPFLNNNGKDVFMRRTRTTAQILTHMGLDLFDDEMFQLIEQYYLKIEAAL